MNLKDLIEKRAAALAIAQKIAALPDASDDQRSQFDAALAEADKIAGDIKRAELLAASIAAAPELPAGSGQRQAPAFNRTKLGENEMSAAMHYIRTGQPNSALRGMDSEYRASNDTDMNIGTPADGGYAVPTGHYQGIVAKRNEVMLADKVGVMRIPGKGTTVGVPTDNGTANEFVSTAEAAAFDRDAPVLAKPSMTLVKYTKKVELQYELLEDEDSAIQVFLNDYVGRALARTHNSLLVTEALAGGTSVAMAGAAAVAVADVNNISYALAGEYADNAQWVMKRATEGKYRALQGNPFSYQATPASNGRDFAGFPINNSEYVPAVATGLKSTIFGNFNFIGLREAPGLTFLRDPYSGAGTGTVRLFYYTRVVYKTLQATAIYYGTHP